MKKWKQEDERQSMSDPGFYLTHLRFAFSPREPIRLPRMNKGGYPPRGVWHIAQEVGLSGQLGILWVMPDHGRDCKGWCFGRWGVFCLALSASGEPMDLDEVFELLELGVSGHHLSVLAQGGRGDEGISIGNGIFGLDLRSLEDQIIGAGNYPDGQQPESFQDVAGELEVLEPGAAVEDLAEVDDVHDDLPLTALGPVQEVFDYLGPLLILDPRQNGEGIEQ